ncbi:MAG: VCBS repeat-containing protein [Sandaracinaceae bacterium]
MFDFEGDGAAEVVYADENSFRIFDGRTGRVLYQDDCTSSNTRLEMPIVDVDNDGKSEVVIPEPNRSSVDLGGIEIWEDAENNWVRTRRVWNQHTYHVTNI